MTRKLLIRVNHIGDNDFGGNGGDCDTCLLEIDAGFRKRMSLLRKKVSPLFKQPGFYAAEFFDYTIDPVTLGEDDDQFGSALNGPGYAEVPVGYKLDPLLTFTTDASSVLIKETGFLWTFYERHTDESYETEEVPWSILDKG